MRLLVAALAAASLLGACGDVAIVTDTVHSRLVLGSATESTSRVYTAGLVLFEDSSTDDVPAGRPEVTPTFTIEVEAVEEPGTDSAASRLVVEVDGEVTITTLVLRSDGRRIARSRTSIRRPRRWEGCARDAQVTIERDASAGPSSAYGVTVHVASRYRSGRMDDGYREFAEISRVSVP